MITKTLNPIHFEDLEPHRFEDLVRQLIYDFKDWKSIEATGRSGSDEGFDVRASENVNVEEVTEEQDDDNEKVITTQDRLWLIQCKREKSITPKKLKRYAEDIEVIPEQPVYGVIFAACCDFSKKARDTFISIIRAKGIQEFHLWGKAELEDMLFQPKNDHLLFAYFGISLQIRRRSIKSQVRSRLTIKKKLFNIFDGFHGRTSIPILIRDPKNTQYPYINNSSEFLKNTPWRYWYLESHDPPDHLAFIVNKFFAYANWKNREWDFLKDCNTAIPNHPALYGLSHDAFDPECKQEIYRIYSERNIPEQNRAWALTIRFIHYDRILAIDELGDIYHDKPHLLVDYVDGKDPFEPNWYHTVIKSVEVFSNDSFRPEKKLRKNFFPKIVPDERKIYYKELEEKLNKNKT